MFGDVAQLVSALRSHRRGRGFESLHPHQTQRHPAGASVFGYVYGTRSGGNGAVALVPKTNGAVASASKQYRAAHNELSGFLHIPDLLEN